MTVYVRMEQGEFYCGDKKEEKIEFDKFIN
jgi:hypothetical protein